jgi:hypothetical protein
VPKDSKYKAEDIAMICPSTVTNRCQSHHRLLHVAVLIVRPSLVLDLRLAFALRVSSGWGTGGERETREDEYGLDGLFVERPEVRLNTTTESKRETARRGNERLARVGVGKEGFDVMRSVDTQPSAGERGQRSRLQELTLPQVGFYASNAHGEVCREKRPRVQ